MNGQPVEQFAFGWLGGEVPYESGLGGVGAELFQ